MAKKFINATHIEGYVYEHSLESKVTGENSKNPGTEFITGTVGIATDDELLNVVQVHFTYVTPKTAKGKPNATYGILENIMDGTYGNVMEHGQENAIKVRIDSAIGLNEWYDFRTPGAPLVSVKRNEGGFIHTIQVLPDEKSRSTFEADMLINSVTRVEANEETGAPEKGRIKGCIFDFRGALLPVEFTVEMPKAIDYFESLDASPKNPIFTRVRGIQISKTINRTITEENAFGEAFVRNVPSSQRDFVINWAQPDVYEWDSEDTILATELSEKMANREIYLADMKKRQEEYQNTKGNALSGGAKAKSAPAATPASKEYKF